MLQSPYQFRNLQFDRYFPAIETNYVTLDNFEATLSAIEHLLNGGIKKYG